MKNNIETLKKRIDIETEKEYSILSDAYINNKAKLEFKHNLCGNIFMTSAHNFFNGGTRCPKCKMNSRIENLNKVRCLVKPKTKTTDEFKDEVYKLVGDEYTVVGEYKTSKTKIAIQHSKCMRIYTVTPNHFLEGRRCPICAGRLKNMEDYSNEINSLKNGEFVFISTETLNNRRFITVRHTKCGNILRIDYSNFKSKNLGCSYCSHRKKLTTDEFKDKVYKLVGDEYTVKSEYINTASSIKMFHKKCNMTYETKPKYFLAGRRCPICHESKGEKLISDILRKKYIKFEREKKFEDCKDIRQLPFDFYLYEDNILIEYDGKQHYDISWAKSEEEFEKTKYHDKIKNEYAMDKGIKLIRIPYWNFNEIEEIINKEICDYKSVSTIPDECKGVDSEISTESKRKALEIEKI